MRVGIGYDIHRLVPTIKNSSIPIGGVEIPCFYKIQAHSDGDVLLHALVDACLGALALGDIGQWFPDTAKENEKRSSKEFVATVLKEVRRLKFRVNQIDSIVLLEEPKLFPHSDAIRQSVALLFGLELSNVSLKAKTMEGLGAVGERRAVSSQVVVTLEEE